MPRLNENSYRFWDLVLKAASAIGFIVAALFSYHQYLDTAMREARKPFLEKRLQLCLEAADSAATIATSPKPDDVATAVVTLDRLYWGSMAIVDNQPIASAMKNFHDAIKTRVPEGDSMGTKRSRETLTPLSEKIAHECRDLMIESWNVPGMLPGIDRGSPLQEDFKARGSAAQGNKPSPTRGRSP